MTGMSAFLKRCRAAGMVLGLDQMRILLTQLGNPQDQLRVVQVAGTNGKGSVVAYLASVLTEAGYRVGEYHSPAVFSEWETVQVQGVPITEAEAERMYARVEAAAGQMEAAGSGFPTEFEAQTAMALLYFAEQGCEVVILEAGLGGDLDATNVVTTTDCSVLTSISLDHKRILGDTIRQIAAHKAGIIKPGAAVAWYGQPGDVDEVILARCRETAQTLTPTAVQPVMHRMERTRISSGQPAALNGQCFTYTSATGHCYHVQILLLGDFQQCNASTAIEACEALQERGYHITAGQILSGLAKTTWPGRLEVICARPLVLLDGAHNPDAARVLHDALLQLTPDRRRYFVMGIFVDKDVRAVTEIMAPLADDITTVTPPNPRALPAAELAALLQDQTAVPVRPIADAAEAAAAVWRWAAPEDVIIAFGSLSFLGVFRTAIQALDGKDR